MDNFTHFFIPGAFTKFSGKRKYKFCSMKTSHLSSQTLHNLPVGIIAIAEEFSERVLKQTFVVIPY
jgi:hypothetical protein